MRVDEALLQQEAAAQAHALQVDVFVVARQALQQFAQHQRLAAVLQVRLHVVQGVQVDHEQAAAAVGRHRRHEIAQLVEEADVEVVFVRMQPQVGPVVADKEAVRQEQDLVLVQRCRT
jgi:hypothetical protein